VLARPIDIYGGTGGNTVNGSALTGVTDNLDIYGAAGADVLKGGAGNDIFVFTAANLTKTDTVSGGGGNNELLMTAPGTVDANGVSGVESYVLADGAANTLTLTSANFAGVAGSTITVSDGNNGNTVSATGVAAPDRIIVYAGNDVFSAGGDTTMTGGAGAKVFVFSAPGSNTIADFTASAINEMEFVSGSGFVLPGATTTPQPLGGLFVQDSAGSFTNGAERFAYGATNGNSTTRPAAPPPASSW
jgi:Ca2+-binding RTX toxin-like protein